MSDDKPIIVIKKKGGHGGHHGGAWKVAYADFVTAMMAFFMVMWLLNSASQPTKQNIASYFKKPGIFQEGSGTPLMIGEAGILTDAYVPPHPEDEISSSGTSQEPLLKKSGTDDDDSHDGRVSKTGLEGKGITEGAADTSGHHKQASELKYSGMVNPTKGEAKGETKEKFNIDKNESKASPNSEENQQKQAQQQALARQRQQIGIEKLAEKVRKQVEKYPELEEILGIVDVKLEADGLNIEIIDTEKTSMFKSGVAAIEPGARAAFARLADILKDVPNTIEVIGHTDAVPFRTRRGYSNWELSADRANAARRVLQSEGIEHDRFVGVVGKGDRSLRKPEEPFAAANRRITMKLKFHEAMVLDLGEDPDALKDIKEELKKQIPKEEESAPAVTITTDNGEATFHKRDDGTFSPPPETESLPAEGEKPKNRIFDNNPIIGPPDPFTGF